MAEEARRRVGLGRGLRAAVAAAAAPVDCVVVAVDYVGGVAVAVMMMRSWLWRRCWRNGLIARTWLQTADFRQKMYRSF